MIRSTNTVSGHRLEQYLLYIVNARVSVFQRGLYMAVNTVLPVQGLTEGEARARRQRGEGNDTGGASSRSYWDIARANLFTLFNNILFTIGVALIALGRVNDALTSVGWASSMP